MRLIVNVIRKKPKESTLRELPGGLSITEVARRLSVSWHVARRLIRNANYPFLDGRHIGQNFRRKVWLDVLDPSKTAKEIAELCGVSKQRISFLASQHEIKLADGRGRYPRRKSRRKRA